MTTQKPHNPAKELRTRQAEIMVAKIDATIAALGPCTQLQIAKVVGISASGIANYLKYILAQDMAHIAVPRGTEAAIYATGPKEYVSVVTDGDEDTPKVRRTQSWPSSDCRRDHLVAAFYGPTGRAIA